ncbi:glycosyltransferase family 10 domain-containing protein [Roseobacter sp. HKCCD5988]|uniref:glycosyltransferase family 10 domain-containing protein n=1 Tax=Roseobacter sp. HKCCD5988 TaxID=3120338 RepID=UPI0030EF4B31
MLKVSLINVSKGYTENLIFQALKLLIDVEITDPKNAELIIKGPYREKNKFKRLKNKLISKKAIVLFDSAENTRHLDTRADFYITHDLGVTSEQHIRVPHWYNVIDWRNQGLPILGETKRFGRPISIDELTNPRSYDQFQSRENRAIIFASHLREPRKTLLDEVGKYLPIDGYGIAFDTTIRDHNESGFFKNNILKKYRYNVCPENSLGPGYYTEKVVEAYAAGCIPIYWCDQNCSIDFNKNSFINSYDYVNIRGYDLSILNKKQRLKSMYIQPLIIDTPKLDSIFKFLEKLIMACKNQHRTKFSDPKA